MMEGKLSTGIKDLGVSLTGGQEDFEGLVAGGRGRTKSER
jgi:hypothetical protein